MALQKAGLPVQFRGGLQTKEDHKSVPATQLLDLQNAVFTRQTTLSKRYGYAAKSTAIDGAGSDYINAKALTARDSELLLLTDDRCYSHRSSNDRWSDAGEVAGVTCTDTPIARTGTQQWAPDVASRNGVAVAAWEDSRGGVWMSVLEDATGRILLNEVQLDSTGISPRCMEVGEVVVVLWMRTASQRIYSAVVNPADPAVTPTPQILTDDLSAANPVFDATPTLGAYDALTAIATDRPAVIAWAVAGGYRTGYVHPSGVLGSPANGLPSVATIADTVTGPIAIAVDRASAYATAVLWTDNAGQVHGRFHDPEDLLTAVRGGTALNLGAAIAGPPTFLRLACDYGFYDTNNGGKLSWVVEVQGATSDLNYLVSGAAWPNDSALDSTTTTLKGHTLLTRAFHDGPSDAASVDQWHVYVTIGHFVKLFPYAAVIRLDGEDGIGSTNTITSARILPGTALGGLVRNMNTAAAYSRTLPSVEDRGALTVSSGSSIPYTTTATSEGLSDDSVFSRIHRFPVNIRLQLDSSDGDQFSELGIRLVELDFDNANARQTIQLGRGLYLASACPQHYDGERWVEADVHTAPDWGFNVGTSSWKDPADAFTASNGTGSMGLGTYLYKIWYEDIDAQGEIHPGAPSIGVLVTLSGMQDTVTIAVPTLRNTRKRNVRIGIARSQQGATGTDESIQFFRASGLDPEVNTGNNRYVANDPTVDTVTFVDGLVDADLAVREPLYTNGGILPNAPSPWSGLAVAGGKSRLFWTDPNDPNLVRFSQQLRDDTGLEAPINLALRCDPYGGRILAIGVMDEAVYVFKQTAVMVFAGPGPQANPDAAPDQFSFSGAELVTADVGCVGPAAIVQTPSGIMFPTVKGIRLLSRQRQILPIGDPVYAYQDQTFTRGTLLPDRPHILFLTSSGSTLLYDYERDQWSRFTNHEGLDAVVVDGTYHYLRTDGRVFAETVGEYVDDNSHIPMKIETAWIKAAGYLQGWQKILHAHFLGEYKSAHTLRARWRIDYQAGYSAPNDMDVNTNFDPQLYGEGLYGAGFYGGAEQAGTVYQRSVHINRRCQSISFLIEDVEATDDYGASFELSELLLTGGVLGPEFKVGAARRS